MKKLIAGILILSIVLAGGFIYINKVYLPAKIKSLIVQGIESQTGAKVKLGTVSLNLFKGLVLNDLALYDRDKPVLTLKQGSCTFLIWPFFKKQLVITGIRFDSAAIFLERRADQGFNWTELFKKKPGASDKGIFNVLVYRISITNSRIDYRDLTFNPPLERSLTDLDVSASLSLPASVKFKMKGAIPAKSEIKIYSEGEYRIPQRGFSAKFSLTDIAPAEFSEYFKSCGFLISAGIMDSSGTFTYLNDAFSGDIVLKVRNALASKDQVVLKLNAEIQARLDYELKGKGLKYSGSAAISGSDVSGLANIGGVKDINGVVEFNNEKASCQALKAQVLGLPVRIDASIMDFNDPQIKLGAAADVSLSACRDILKEQFKIELPLVAKGQGQLVLNLKLRPLAGDLPELNGYIDLADASVKMDKLEAPLEKLSGRIDFTLTGLSWKGVSFVFSGNDFKSNGALVNFQRPAVELALNSQDLKMDSNFSVIDKNIKVSKFTVSYLNSGVSFSGDIDAGKDNPEAQVLGDAYIELADLSKLSPQFKEELSQVNPQGLLKIKFGLSGNPVDIKSCLISGKVTCDSIRLYGLQGAGLLVNLSLKDKMLEINQAHLELYDGVIDLVAKANLDSQNLPVLAEFVTKDVKIEKLKNDTPAKDKDLAGIMQAHVKISSFGKDLLKTSGTGKILVTQGKLWELNFFKGIGKFIFAQDFANIVVSEASCPFVIQNGVISTDNLKMLSNLAEISGPVRIGFDGSLQSELNVSILGNAAPDTATFKDIATAIVGTAGKFGTITISGTLKEPKYKFKPAVADIFKSIKDAIFLQ